MIKINKMTKTIMIRDMIQMIVKKNQLIVEKAESK